MIARRTPIARVGRRAAREAPARAAFARALRERGNGYCEACVQYMPPGTRERVCGNRFMHPGQDPHHLWPEDRDAGRHDPDRGLWLCRHAHRWAHDHPAEAQRLGLLRPHSDAV